MAEPQESIQRVATLSITREQEQAILDELGLTAADAVDRIEVDSDWVRVTTLKRSLDHANGLLKALGLTSRRDIEGIVIETGKATVTSIA